MQTTQTQLISEVSRDVVAQLAPRELMLYRTASEAFFEAPPRASKRSSRDEMLGFGVGEASVLWTPIVLSVMTRVFEFVTHEIQKHLAAESSSLLGDMVKGLFKKFRKQEEPPPPPPPPEVSVDLLERVRQITRETAGELLPADKATLLANAVVGILALPPVQEGV